VAIVEDINSAPQPEGEQTIVANEPEQTGLGPESSAWIPPSYLNSQYAPQAESPSNGQYSPLNGVSGGSNALRDRLVSAGMRYIGQPYSWGNLDCSGLVQRAYAAVGIHLPRISYQQANTGKRVNIGDLQAGDLVAWDEGPRNPGADHIAIYIGNGQILEAAHTGTDVRVRKLGKNEGAWGVHMSIGD
jgi:cell wall-associated NlpC family hydrolase